MFTSRRKDNNLYRGLIRDLIYLFYDKQPWPLLPSSNIIGCHLSISNWLFDISWKDLSLLTQPERLHQCLINVLENAAKYSPEASPIYLSQGTSSECFFCEIKDHGPGISIEDQANIFKPFFRGMQHNQSVPGSGVGLALVSQLVDLMNGRIAVADSSALGTVIRLEFSVVRWLLIQHAHRLNPLTVGLWLCVDQWASRCSLLWRIFCCWVRLYWTGHSPCSVEYCELFLVLSPHELFCSWGLLRLSKAWLRWPLRGSLTDGCRVAPEMVS